MTITLANIDDTPLQEVFDAMLAHLRKQGCKSERYGDNDRRFCMYRHPDGLKCAVGIFIADDEYRDCYEGRSAEEVLADRSVSPALRYLLSQAQDIHDNYAVHQWEHAFENLAFHTNNEFQTDLVYFPPTP
jgi:hypothetical protein